MTDGFSFGHKGTQPVACPTCKAAAGQNCRTLGKSPRPTGNHKARTDANIDRLSRSIYEETQRLVRIVNGHS